MEWVGVLGDSYLLTGANLRPEKSLSASARGGQEEYILAIRLGADIYNKITEESDVLYQQFLPQKSFDTDAYLTIGRFGAKEWMEDTMIRWIQRICAKIRAFQVTLNNFSGFPPHSIYLRVLDKEPFRRMAQELKIVNDYLLSNQCPEISFARPGICIARELPAAVYEKAMPAFSQRLFCETFTANELVLLRRHIETGTCKTINVFGLIPGENDLFN